MIDCVKGGHKLQNTDVILCVLSRPYFAWIYPFGFPGRNDLLHIFKLLLWDGFKIKIKHSLSYTRNPVTSSKISIYAFFESRKSIYTIYNNGAIIWGHNFRKYCLQILVRIFICLAYALWFTYLVNKYFTFIKLSVITQNEIYCAAQVYKIVLSIQNED